MRVVGDGARSCIVIISGLYRSSVMLVKLTQAIRSELGLCKAGYRAGWPRSWQPFKPIGRNISGFAQQAAATPSFQTLRVAEIPCIWQRIACNVPKTRGM